MRKLIFLFIPTFILIVGCSSHKRVPMCRYCKTVDVYFMQYGHYTEYIVLDYMDSMYYQHNDSWRSQCEMGYFKIHNDTLTLVNTSVMYRSKDQIRVVQSEKSELDKYYTYNYRIEDGGNSIFMKQLQFFQEYLGDIKPRLCIQRFYKCNGSLKYVPNDDKYPYENEEYERDSMLRLYEESLKSHDSLDVRRE